MIDKNIFVTHIWRESIILLDRKINFYTEDTKIIIYKLIKTGEKITVTTI